MSNNQPKPSDQRGPREKLTGSIGKTLAAIALRVVRRRGHGTGQASAKGERLNN